MESGACNNSRDPNMPVTNTKHRLTHRIRFPKRRKQHKTEAKPVRSVGSLRRGRHLTQPDLEEIVARNSAQRHTGPGLLKPRQEWNPDLGRSPAAAANLHRVDIIVARCTCTQELPHWSRPADINCPL
jgi:hypothetical protein